MTANFLGKKHSKDRMEIPNTLLEKISSGTLDHDSLRESTHESCNEVDYLARPVTYGEFFEKYLLTNRPCVLGPWATEAWRSREEWVNKDGSPNLELLAEKFGDSKVPVANCGEEEYSSHPKSEMTLREYITYIKSVSSQDKTSKDSLYLKDWHFTRIFPDYDAYTTPPYFCSDWLNEFWESKNKAEDQKDDYRFVYFGPKNSWTPFHADVFCSYSWSANICGLKLWWLFPPGEEVHLKDKFGQLAFDLRSSDLEDSSKFPKYTPSSRRMEVRQKAGEVLFVPSRWHHQVFNLENTISINHNWVNGCNVDLCWRFIQDSLVEVKREIADCQEMDGWNQQCQLILKASSGIDYEEFYRFIHMIGRQRIDFLNSAKPRKDNASESEASLETNHYYTVRDRNHAIFDLIKVKSLVSAMVANEDFINLENPGIQIVSEFLKIVEDVLAEHLE